MKKFFYFVLGAFLVTTVGSISDNRLTRLEDLIVENLIVNKQLVVRESITVGDTRRGEKLNLINLGFTPKNEPKLNLMRGFSKHSQRADSQVILQACEANSLLILDAPQRDTIVHSDIGTLLHRKK